MSDFGCLGDKIALRTHHGKYVVAESNGDVNADRKIGLSYETFTVKELGGNKIVQRKIFNYCKIRFLCLKVFAVGTG